MVVVVGVGRGEGRKEGRKGRKETEVRAHATPARGVRSGARVSGGGGGGEARCARGEGEGARVT